MRLDELPGPVSEACEALLGLVPADLVDGLYLRGGVGFGEWVLGQSDVDFVMTLTRRPAPLDLVVLEDAHDELARRLPGLYVDGMHVLAADLARDPEALPPVPTVLVRTFAPATDTDALVAWHELAGHGVTVSGPDLGSLEVWTSPERLRSSTVENLDTYWRAHAEALALKPAEGGSVAGCTWCVLGVTRLHHLLVTGAMTTKSAAGRWALTCCPERLHAVLEEAVALRGDIRGRDGSEPLRTAAEAVPAGSRAWAHRARQVSDLTSWVVGQGTGRAV